MTRSTFRGPALVADIGGTHARFALASHPDRAPTPFTRLACAEHRTLQALLSSALAFLGPDERPRRAALAVAAPVRGDRVRLTNLSWEFSINAVKRHLGFDELLVLNDFEALAWSLPALSAMGGEVLKPVGSGEADPEGARAVIGPGTGLGVAGLVPSRNGWAVVCGEGGHVSFSPADARESAILLRAWQRFPHVSGERLVSGIGLPVLHEAVCHVDGHPYAPLDVPQITARALDGSDGACVATLDTFCAMLGTMAGNLALTLGASGGVYIAGGIVPRLGSFFDQSAFRERFEAKGRLATHNATIPTCVILADTPALIGAANALSMPAMPAAPSTPPARSHWLETLHRT